MERVDSGPKERREGEQPLGKAGGLGSRGLECEAAWIGGSELASSGLVCTRMCQVTRATGTGQLGGEGQLNGWFQSPSRREGGGGGRDRGGSLGIGALKLRFSVLSDPQGSPRCS